eukprot:m.158019 g.158019  ORF g.158019 m.158019 type:complete len:629 (-) comp17010_c2_seq2:57-1943(-)
MMATLCQRLPVQQLLRRRILTLCTAAAAPAACISAAQAARTSTHASTLPALPRRFASTNTGASWVKGSTDVPLLSTCIHELLETAARERGSSEAVVTRHPQKRLSYSGLLAAVNNLAASFLAAGLQPGDRVGVWALNSAEWVVAQYATAAAGLVLVCVNPAYKAEELEYVVNKVGIRVLICPEEFRHVSTHKALQTLIPDIKHSRGQVSSPSVPSLSHIILMDHPRPAHNRLHLHTFSEFSRLARPQDYVRLKEVQRTLSPDDPINIQFTSGTTGSPKGATLTHRNIVNNGYFVGRAINLTHKDRVCLPVPLYHCFGMVMGTMACLVHKATAVFPSESFDALHVLEAVERERCTSLYGVPTMFIAELEHPRFYDFDLSSLRTGIMAGSPCPREIMQKVMDRMHIKDMTVAYGMTETSPVSFQTQSGDPIDKRVRTVGRVHPHVEARVVNPDTLESAPIGVPGELWVRGYSVMKGYFEDAAKTADAITKNGWMRSGDMAVFDAEGYCQIVGRYKDMIIRGGENIYPVELENFMYKHPDIQDVQIIGVPDRKYGEEVCACVIMKPNAKPLTAHSLRDFLHGKIASYKIPKYVVPLKEYPLTVSGKVQKFALRDAMTKTLKLENEGPAYQT